MKRKGFAVLMALARSLSVPLVSVAAEGRGDGSSISRFASALETRFVQETGIAEASSISASDSMATRDVKELKRGISLLQQGNFGEAEAAFLSARDAARSDKRGSIDAVVGHFYMLANRMDDACRWTEKAIADGPDEWMLHTMLGILYSRNDHQDLPKAIGYLKEAIRLSPRIGINYRILGTLQSMNGDPTGAADTFTKAIAVNPSDAFSYMARGSIYEDLKDYEKALADFRRALSMNLPGKFHETAQMEEGQTLFHLSRYDESLASYGKVLEKDPGNFRAVYMTGLIYKAERKDDTALAWMEKASRLAPQSAGPYDVMGFLYVKQDKKDQAQDCLQKAVDRKSKIMRTYRLLAQLYQRDGKDDEALKILDLAVTRLPHNPDAWSERGWFFLSKKDYARGAADYTEAINLGGEQKALNLTQRGLCYRELNENKKAEADYQEALRLKSDETLAYIGLGNLYNKAGDYDRAIGIYEKGLAAVKEEDKGMILNNLGFTYKEKGDYTKALEILTEGIQKYPNHAETWRSRAQTCDAMGQPEKGIPDMDEFLKRKPGDARGYRFRAALYEKAGKKDLAEKDREKAKALEKGGKQP